MMLETFPCAKWPSVNLLGEMSIQVPWSFLNWVACFFSWWVIGILYIVYFSLCNIIFIIFKYILDINSLADMWLANIFSHSIDRFFTFWVMVFDAQVILNFFVFFFGCASQLPGFSVPWPETEPRPWQWKAGILTTRLPGNYQVFLIFKKFNLFFSFISYNFGVICKQ